jgi:hypothetical protein
MKTCTAKTLALRRMASSMFSAVDSLESGSKPGRPNLAFLPSISPSHSSNWLTIEVPPEARRAMALRVEAGITLR